MLVLVAVLDAVSGAGSQATAGAVKPVPSGPTACYVSLGRCSLQPCVEYIGAGAAVPMVASSGAIYVPAPVVPAPRNVGHCRRFPAPLTSAVVRSGRPPAAIRARPATPNLLVPLAQLRRRVFHGG